MVLEIIEGLGLLHVFSYISHYNSRSRHARVKHSIRQIVPLHEAHILAIDIFDLSNGSRDN